MVGAGAIAEEGSAAPAPSTSAPGKPAQPPATSPTEAKPPTVGAPALEPKEEASLKEGAKRKSVEQLEEEARRILEEEEALAAAAKQAKRRNKLQELQEVRGSLRRKQVEILEKQEELLEKDQTVQVLQMEVRRSAPPCPASPSGPPTVPAATHRLIHAGHAIFAPWARYMLTVLPRCPPCAEGIDPSFYQSQPV